MPKEKTAKAPKEGKAKKKDGPKRGLSAYMFFSQAERENVKNDNPSAKFGDIGKLLGEKWKTLSEDDKKPYNDMAAKDKLRYEEEVKASGGEVKASKPKKAKKAKDEEEPDDEDVEEDE